MNVLFIGGQKTAVTVKPLQKNLQNSGVNIITEMYIEDIQNVYNRGDSFDKLVVIQPAWTHNKQFTLDQMTTDMYGNQCTVSQSLITLIGDLAQRKQVNQQFIFIPAVGEIDASELIQSEIIQLHGSAAVIVQPAKLSVQFMAGLILKDIDAYDPELIYKPQPVETGDDYEQWQPQDGSDGNDFGRDQGWNIDDSNKNSDESDGNGFGDFGDQQGFGDQQDWGGQSGSGWPNGGQDNSWIDNGGDNGASGNNDWDDGDNGESGDGWVDSGNDQMRDDNFNGGDSQGQGDFNTADWDNSQTGGDNFGYTPDPGFNPDGGVDVSDFNTNRPMEEQPVQDNGNNDVSKIDNNAGNQVDPYGETNKQAEQSPDPYKTDMDINNGYNYEYGDGQNIENTGDPQFGTAGGSGNLGGQKDDPYGLDGQPQGDPYDDGGSLVQPPEQSQFNGGNIYPVEDTNFGTTGTDPYGPGNRDPYNDNGNPDNGYQNNGYPDNGYQNNGYPDNGYQNNGYQNNGYPDSGYQNNGYPEHEQQNADDIYGDDSQQMVQPQPVQQPQPQQVPQQQPKKKKGLFIGFGKKQHQQPPVQQVQQQMPVQNQNVQSVSMSNSPYDEVNNSPYGDDPIDMRPVGADGQRQLNDVNLNDVQKLFAAFANRGNSILVTGAPGAGTQTIAYQLANVLRLMNYSVLLVDFDTVGRSQSYITEANYNATDPDENKLAQAVNSSQGISKHLIIPSQNLHLLDLGLALDSKPLEEMIQKNRVMKFANSAKNGHNFVIYDAPFEAATGHLDDLTTMQDNIVIVSDASTWGSMKTLLYMMNIADDTVLETMFNKSQILFNRYRGYPKILDQKIRNPQDILKAMDKQVEKLVGTDIGYQFQQMHCCGSLGYIDKFEEGWLGKDKQQYTATRDGSAVFIEILKNIVLKGSGR